MTNFIRLLAVFLLATTIAGASVCSPTPNPKRFNPGDIMKTSDWNNTVPGVYTWINSNIVNTLNKLTAKGDLYIYDGNQLQKRAVGSNGQVLVSRSSDSYGVNWETYTGEDPRTTKGDLVYYDGAGHVSRLPVGVDGAVLTLVDGLPLWTDSTSNPFPKGSIVSWSPAAAGTSTIPSGWTLCDGSMGSPNLIGLFTIGTKPTGSSSSPSPGGFGAYTADTAHGSATHTHAGVAGGTLTTGTSSVQIIRSGSGSSTGSTDHTHQIGNFVRSIAAHSCEPADWALVYIMKL